MTGATACVFCEIVAGRAPADVLGTTPDVLIITPLGPVTPGHVLLIPKRHVADASEDLLLTADVMAVAAVYARRLGRPFNLITSAGREATQSVFHLHVHYVPRAADDGLMVPWGTAWGENPHDPHRCRGMAALERQVAELHAKYGRPEPAEVPNG